MIIPFAIRRIVLGTLIAALAGVACGGAGDEPRTRTVRAVCDVHQGACTAQLGNRVLTLDITPKPVKAMEDIAFTVTLTGEPPKKSPVIDLNMVAMDMGPNRVELKRAGDGTYTGTGVIVRCPSGKRKWKALVTVSGVGAAEFVFDVVY
jgi:hypothetical protein